MSRVKAIAIICAATAAYLTMAAPSHAIDCRGGNQLSGGRLIATPYCQDEYLAQVARSYGIRTSGDAMRYDFSAKSSVCHAIGHDSRVRESCSGFRRDDSGRNRRWP